MMSKENKIDPNHFLVQPYVKQQKKDIKAFRREASRLASMANKRMQRLERNKLKDSPAYQSVVENGEPRFGIKGKSYNEVQAEVSRMKKFIDAETSTVRGANKNLKNIASYTGIKYKKMKDLKKKAKTFFDLSSKVEQYLRTVDDMASSIGYQKIWEAVNEYVEGEQKDLDSAQFSVEKATKDIADAIKEYEEKQTLRAVEGENAWYKLKDE